METFKNNTDSYGAGKYLIGDEIKAGLYYIEDCTYWARLKNLKGEFDSIIANGNPQGSVYALIKDTDKAFELMDGKMYLVTDEKIAEKITTFTEGTYKCAGGEMGY